MLTMMRTGCRLRQRLVECIGIGVIPTKACEMTRKQAAKARRQMGDDNLMVCVGVVSGRGGRGGEVGQPLVS